MSRIRTLEQLTDHLEKELTTFVDSYESLSNDDYIKLASDVGFIEYTTPWAISYPSLTKYRKLWGRKLWLKFLTGLEKGKFWPRLSENQQYFLETGKEKS